MSGTHSQQLSVSPHNQPRSSHCLNTDTATLSGAASKSSAAVDSNGGVDESDDDREIECYDPGQQKPTTRKTSRKKAVRRESNQYDLMLAKLLSKQQGWPQETTLHRLQHLQDAPAEPFLLSKDVLSSPSNIISLVAAHLNDSDAGVAIAAAHTRKTSRKKAVRRESNQYDLMLAKLLSKQQGWPQETTLHRLQHLQDAPAEPFLLSKDVLSSPSNIISLVAAHLNDSDAGVAIAAAHPIKESVSLDKKKSHDDDDDDCDKDDGNENSGDDECPSGDSMETEMDVKLATNL